MDIEEIIIKINPSVIGITRELNNIYMELLKDNYNYVLEENITIEEDTTDISIYNMYINMLYNIGYDMLYSVGCTINKKEYIHLSLLKDIVEYTFFYYKHNSDIDKYLDILYDNELNNIMKISMLMSLVTTVDISEALNAIEDVSDDLILKIKKTYEELDGFNNNIDNKDLYIKLIKYKPCKLLDLYINNKIKNIDNVYDLFITYVNNYVTVDTYLIDNILKDFFVSLIIYHKGNIENIRTTITNSDNIIDFLNTKGFDINRDTFIKELNKYIRIYEDTRSISDEN